MLKIAIWSIGCPLFILIIVCLCRGVSAQNVQPFPSNGLVNPSVSTSGQVLQGWACVDTGRGSLFCLSLTGQSSSCYGVMVRMSTGVVSQYPAYSNTPTTNCFSLFLPNLGGMTSNALILIRSSKVYAFGQNIGVFDLAFPSMLAPITWPNARQTLVLAIGNYILLSSGVLATATNTPASPCGTAFFPIFCFAELFDTTTNTFASTTYSATSVANFAPVCNGVVYFVGTVWSNGNSVGSTVDMFDTSKLSPGAAWNTVGWSSSGLSTIIASAAYCHGSTLLILDHTPVNTAASNSSTVYLVRSVVSHISYLTRYTPS
jgi:hypothetical protein